MIEATDNLSVPFVSGEFPYSRQILHLQATKKNNITTSSSICFVCSWNNADQRGTTAFVVLSHLLQEKTFSRTELERQSWCRKYQQSKRHGEFYSCVTRWQSGGRWKGFTASGCDCRIKLPEVHNVAFGETALRSQEWTNWTQAKGAKWDCLLPCCFSWTKPTQYCCWKVFVRQ